MSNYEMLWTFSITASFKHGGWVTIGVTKDVQGLHPFGDTTPNRFSWFKNHPVIQKFLKDFGFESLGGDVEEGISDLTFQFRVLVDNKSLNAAGNKNTISIDSHNLAAIRNLLNADPQFTSYFGCKLYIQPPKPNRLPIAKPIAAAPNFLDSIPEQPIRAITPQAVLDLMEKLGQPQRPTFKTKEIKEKIRDPQVVLQTIKATENTGESDDAQPNIAGPNRSLGGDDDG